jgi:hypothetical protein
MATPKLAIRYPRQLLSDMRGAAHRESLCRGYNVTWVQLVIELSERYLQRSVGSQQQVHVGG